MKTSIRAGAAGLLIGLVAAAPAAAGPDALVRIEGQSVALPRTAVSLPDGTETNTGCPGDSASAAIELGTKGNWDRGEFTETILGETHDFSNNDYWGFWVFRNGAYEISNGVCVERLTAGEELLGAVQIANPDTFESTIFPLWLTGVPAVVRPGVPFSVTVNMAVCETAQCAPGEGRREPAAGALVSAGGVTATAGADGVATLTVTERGSVGLRATQAARVPSAREQTCVTDGSDGFCGYQLPTSAPPPSTATPPGAVADRTAPRARIVRLKKRYRKGKGPRVLRARVSDAGGLEDVALWLRRKRRGRCTSFDGNLVRFRKVRCGRRLLFSVGPEDRLSYLLPKRLRKGRYRFEVVGFDAAGNRSSAIRRFRVR